MYHMHTTLIYTENVCILAGNGERNAAESLHLPIVYYK